MSDERLQELGLPRREFLKRAAIGAFTAPVIVSFGLAGTAEAAATCYPNQTFANQTHTLFVDLTNATYTVWQYEQVNGIDHVFARQLRSRYLRVAETVLDDDPHGFCNGLSDLQRLITRQSGRKINPTYASDLLLLINSLQSAYCQCVT